MRFKIDFNYLKNFVRQYPMLQLKDCLWDLTEDYYFTKDPKKGKPFEDTEKEIFHRVEADLYFEEFKDSGEFLETAQKFFQGEFHSFENKRHFFLLGNPKELNFSECSNWQVISGVLHAAGLFEYFKSSKLSIGIPFGQHKVIFSFSGGFLFIDIPDVEDVSERILTDLPLTTKEERSWAEICYAQFEKENQK